MTTTVHSIVAVGTWAETRFSGFTIRIGAMMRDIQTNMLRADPLLPFYVYLNHLGS